MAHGSLLGTMSTDVSYFFFQAEDGIRDLTVTGVQTCALPISIRFMERPMRFYNAGSGECFGDTGNERATEESPFHPRSPYAVAKASAHGLVAKIGRASCRERV